MTKERKIEILKDLLIQLSDSANILCTCEADERCEVVEECIKALEQPTNDDCVSRAEVKEFVEYIQSIKDDHNTKGAPINYGTICDLVIRGWKLMDLPPVTPTQCIATVQFSKEDLKDICNERIEVACQHGTCKDCKHWKDSDGVYRRGVGAESKCPINNSRVFEGTFYCANFEMRGSENE